MCMYFLKCIVTSKIRQRIFLSKMTAMTMLMLCFWLLLMKFLQKVNKKDDTQLHEQELNYCYFLKLQQDCLLFNQMTKIPIHWDNNKKIKDKISKIPETDTMFYFLSNFFFITAMAIIVRVGTFNQEHNNNRELI